MKYLAGKFIVCLFLGVILTVLVAWAIALAVNPVAGTNEGGPRPVDTYQWDVGATTAFGTLNLHSRRHQTRTGYTATTPGQFIPFWSDFDVPLPEYRGEPGFDEYRSLEARGWPMLALRTQSAYLNTPNGVLRDQDDAWSIRWPWGQWKIYPFDDRTRTPGLFDILLPLRPVWPGFAVNTLVFALAMWIPFVFIYLRNQHWRRWKRACQRCGYPRGRSDVCTECGQRHART